MVKLAGLVVEFFEAVEARPTLPRQNGAQMLAVSKKVYGQQINRFCLCGWLDQPRDFRRQKHRDLMPESCPILNAKAALLVEVSDDLPNFEITNASCF